MPPRRQNASPASPAAGSRVSDVTPAEIVSFWREAGPERWFEQDDDFDLSIKSRFLAVHEAAARGELAAFEESAEGALALAILLDQFSRNMFRGTARAFATDPLARAVADRAIARGFDQATDEALRQFFYLPFMHSELLADQDRSVAALCGARRCRPIELRTRPSRYHYEIRPISASQPRAGTRNDTCRARVSRCRRVRRIAAFRPRRRRCALQSRTGRMGGRIEDD